MPYDFTPYNLLDFHETLRDMATAYLRLETLRAAAAYSGRSGADHVEFWNIVQRLFPHEATEESRMPDESLYVGDAPVALGDVKSTSVHRLVYYLCLGTLEEILKITQDIIPKPDRKPWPPAEEMRVSHCAVIPVSGLETLTSVVLRDHDGYITAEILRRLPLRPLKTDEETILLMLAVECYRATYRQTLMDAATRLSTVPGRTQPPTSSDKQVRFKKVEPKKLPGRRQAPTLSELEAAAFRLREEVLPGGKRSFGQVADELNKLGFRKRDESAHDYGSAKAAYRNASEKDKPT